jgi:MFS family permease
MPNSSSKATLPLILLIGGCLVAMLTYGPRSAMGFFQLPILETHSWDRTTFALAMAIQNLMWGVGQPFFGVIADKFGTWRVLAFSGVSYATGLYLMSIADTPTKLYIGGGILVGLGIASGSFTIIMAAFARNVAPEKQTLVFGLGTAAGSAGMTVFSPVSVAMIEALGWQDTLVWLALLMLVIPILGIPLVGNSSTSMVASTEYKQSVGDALREAFGHSSYLLLTAGFFVCGFQVSFIGAHLPAYINDIGIEAKWAGIALLLIGLFNVIGSLGSGFLSQKYPKPEFLAWIYICRSIVITAFLLLPQTSTSVVIFASAMGILWLSTVPPTNGLVAVMFGTGYLGMLGGIVFFFHQLGSFLGVWLGGYLFGIFGSFEIVWWLGVALGIFAAIVHWPIKERRVERMASI